jgi:hypothetical protein
MAWRTEKRGPNELDYVWDGVELGIAPSPTKGIANIQNANISSEVGEIMASFARTAQQPLTVVNGTLTPDGATLFNAPATLSPGVWIKVTASTVSSIVASTDPTTFEISYVAVGGGGGGGFAGTNDTNIGSAGGGGGAGQVVVGTDDLAVGSYAITIGEGGAGSSSVSSTGSKGEDTVIAGVVTAEGGGGGGSASRDNITAINGAAGGNGGGGASRGNPSSQGTGGTGDDFDGGGGGNNTRAAGGGGGGASENGNAGSGLTAGDGGDGIVETLTGDGLQLGGGGGGGASNSAGAVGGGGLGGGGTGGNADSSTLPTAGEANTGGGGGGGGNLSGGSQDGAAGGSGIVIIAYEANAAICKGGDEVFINGTKIVHVFRTSGTFEVLAVNTDGLYYVSYKDTNGDVKLSSYYDPYSENPLTHGTTGSITFTVLAVPGRGIAKAVEPYGTATDTEGRYYILDHNKRVWVFDTAVYDYTLATFGVGTGWAMADSLDYSVFSLTGMAVLNGWLCVVGRAAIYGKPTVNLGFSFLPLTDMELNNPNGVHNNFAYVGNQGKLYCADKNYLAEVFPTNSFLTFLANVQSYCSYTASGTTCTISAIIGGSAPFTRDANGAVARIPAVFMTDVYGTLPSGMDPSAVYWIEMDPYLGTFEVYNNKTGGSARTMNTGTGKQYFNTFYPLGSDAGYNGTNQTVQFTQQRLNLPYNETVTSMVEVGNQVIIGGTSNTLYPWNQIDATPSDFVALPEAGVVTMINVNNMAFVFAGNKGNVYITNGSTASLALTIPDYTAGIPGTPSTYVEPYFTWYDAAFIRGRVYCSIQDQTTTKAGNCGGVWSFVPSSNFYYGQDTGLALRLENQNSYGTYNGAATLIIPRLNQADAKAPQFWSSWFSNVTAPTYGIDYTGTTPATTYVVETDLLSTGTFLQKQTFKQVEYKLTTPLAALESVALYYRTNSTNAWTQLTNVRDDTENLSGYYNVNFQKTQWVQLRAVCTTNGLATSSFVRLKELRLR